MIPTPEVLRTAYEQHAAEYRMEVQLGWDRLKFFLSLNVALLAALSAFKGHGLEATAGYAAGALASGLGAHVVWKTHVYYVNARDAFKAIEKELDLDAFAMSTTPGMLQAPWLHTLKITTAGIIVLLTFAALDVALAILAL